MMKSFTEINKDHDRDKITALDDIVAELLEKRQVSQNKYLHISLRTSFYLLTQ